MLAPVDGCPGFVALIAISALIGFVVHALFPAVDTYLATLPDSARASAYAVFSSVWMLVQSLGSFALGLFLESGFTYDSLFVSAAVVLGTSVVVLVIIERAGWLPG